MSITIHRGSLLDADTDAIVNPANLFLRNGAGLARIIETAALKVPVSAQTGKSYPEAAERARKYRGEVNSVPTISTGNVAVTSAGCLPHKGIIHAVGPVWTDGTYGEGYALLRAHERACEEAEKRGWSIGFPAISCGLFRFPADKAAPYALAGVSRHSICGLDVRFYLMEDAHVSAWAEALDNLEGRR